MIPRRPRAGGEGRRALPLDPDKAEKLAALFAALSDADLAALAPAVRAETGASRAARAVADLVTVEVQERRLRDRIFAPLVAQARRGAADPETPLPPETLTLLWRTVRREAPALAADTLAAVDDLTDPARGRAAADALTAAVLEAYGDEGGSGEGGWAALRAALEARRAGSAAALAAHLALCPLARACAPRLDAWLRTASPEHASAIRLAYRDAAAIADHAPPLLLQMLGAGLDPPSQVLRLICAVMDRPKDSFLAVSELARFATGVLDDVDARIQAVRGFDPAQGAPAGGRAAEAVCGAVRALAEFDRSIDVQPSGPWAQRIAAQRRNLARAVEARLRLADPTLARALPMVAARPGSPLRSGPKLDAPLDPLACAKAEALLAFHAGVRPAADGGGFAVLRAKAGEAMDLRLSVYADELVQAAHQREGGEAAEARGRLAFVGDALARVRDPKAAEVLRRRAAAA